VNTCFSCEGGIKTLTLRFNGGTAQTITAEDQQGIVFSQVINPNATFTFSGSLPNDKFVGSDVQLAVGGTPDATIPSNCGTVFVGNVYGSFTIIAADSKNGGPLCCSAAVMDAIPPEITNCPANISISLPASACQVAGGWTAPSATDNCSIGNITTTHGPADLLDVGVTTVTYTAVDIYNNQSTCSFTVTVTDASKPFFTGCPSDIIVESGNSCESVATWTPPIALDNCSATMSSSHEPGDVFPLGETIVTYIASDDAGNAAECSFKVTVKTTEGPSITGCPPDIALHTFDDAVEVTWDAPQATPVCGELVSNSSHQPGARFNAGVTEVVYEFEDATGNKSVCSFNVTVIKDEVVIEVQKAVTPNGDGENDTWQLKNIDRFSDNKVLIVDRWGNRIFSGSGYDNINVLWSANGPNGQKVPIGTYFYTIEIRVNEALVRDSGFIEVVY
jgi:gliding motility-associated-like protein